MCPPNTTIVGRLAVSPPSSHPSPLGVCCNKHSVQKLGQPTTSLAPADLKINPSRFELQAAIATELWNVGCGISRGDVGCAPSEDQSSRGLNFSVTPVPHPTPPPFPLPSPDRRRDCVFAPHLHTRLSYHTFSPCIHCTHPPKHSHILDNASLLGTTHTHLLFTYTP